jgi:hypothetical protein
MGRKIRQSMGDRDACYQLAGLIEMDDTYVGAPNPNKRGLAPGARPRCA